ncbi:MAG: nicotinate-nucleotide adenylyltransferase [Eubacterium sp.]|jgi:nicotinate-nucleotide adenylyltransferase
MDSSSKRIGILGGTFNPIHYGHLIIGDNAMHQYHLDQVIFLPTGHAPHKEYGGEAMTYHRCRMVEEAIADNPRFTISYYETQKNTVSYTYSTLQHFKAEYPDAELYFIVGADSLIEFETWRHPEQICREAILLAAVRDTYNEKKVDTQIAYLQDKYHGRIHRLETPNFNVSGKKLRQRVQTGKTIRYMLPDRVEAYIREHSLYIREEEK